MRIPEVFRNLVAAVSIAVVLVPVANADDAKAVTELKSLLGELKTLHADFTQTVLNDELEPVRESRGAFTLQRAAGKDDLGKFRWDYTAPFEQVIVGDGVNLWTYDPDLEQATVKPMQATLASSPASLLTGSKPVDEEFVIREIGQSGQLYWIALKPQVQDTDFEDVRVAIRDGKLDTMELHDNLGQTTRIRFENVERNQPVKADVFHFTPPADADLIGEPLPAN